MSVKTILIVDDESIITHALSRALEKDPFKIMTAVDGKKGLQIILHHRPDLILLDNLMPRLTGIEVLKKMKEAGLNIPVILMTAYGDAATEKKAQTLGVSAYLTKPFQNIEDVLTLIRSKIKS